MYQYDDADEIYQPYWVRSRYIYHITIMMDIMIIVLIIMVCKVLSFAHYIPDDADDLAMGPLEPKRA